MKHHILHDPINRAYIHIYIKPNDKDIDKLNEWIEKKSDKAQECLHDIKNAHAAACVMTLSPHDFILVTFKDISYDSIVHESLHLAARILRFRRILLKNEDTEEAYAYYIQWLFKEICNLLKPKPLFLKAKCRNRCIFSS